MNSTLSLAPRKYLLIFSFSRKTTEEGNGGLFRLGAEAPVRAKESYNRPTERRATPECSCGDDLYECIEVARPRRSPCGYWPRSGCSVFGRGGDQAQALEFLSAGRRPVSPRLQAKDRWLILGNSWAGTTTRNPLLLFLFVGSFLLRLAERMFLGLLFQEPPRNTR
jgi:hypothetical protein